MLTLFTTNKGFVGHFNIIQRNAIRSWTLLQPKPEIILLGGEPGTAEIAEEFRLRHIPELKHNKFGTPLVSSIFQSGQFNASYPLACYVNSDIILLSDIIKSIQRVAGLMNGGEFLLIGRRWELEMTGTWDFDRPDWEQRLRSVVMSYNHQQSAAATDYFIFPRRIRWDIPAFAIGRSAWDGWFLYNAYSKNIPIIDGSSEIMAVHQHHDYSHWKGGKENYARSQEFTRNQALRGSFRRQFTIHDAQFVLTHEGLIHATWRRRLLAEWLRLSMWTTYQLRSVWYPYSYPLIVILKGIKALVESVNSFRTKKAS